MVSTLQRRHIRRQMQRWKEVCDEKEEIRGEG